MPIGILAVRVSTAMVSANKLFRVSSYLHSTIVSNASFIITQVPRTIHSHPRQQVYVDTYNTSCSHLMDYAFAFRCYCRRKLVIQRKKCFLVIYCDVVPGTHEKLYRHRTPHQHLPARIYSRINLENDACVCEKFFRARENINRVSQLTYPPSPLSTYSRDRRVLHYVYGNPFTSLWPKRGCKM